MILSARSVWRSVLPVAAGLAVAGCSGERSTEPEGPTPLTAIDLSTELVTGVSDWVEAQILRLDEYTFALGDLPMVQADKADDLYIQFIGTWYAETFDIDVFVPDPGIWSCVEAESLLDGTGRVIGPSWQFFDRLALGFSLGEITDLIDSSGSFRFRATHIGHVRTRAVSYAPEYEFTTLQPMSAVRLAGMVLNADHLWVSRAFADQNRERVDSLFIYTLDGVREDACYLPDLQVMSMCRNPRGEIWTAVYVAYRAPYKFALVGRHGEIESSFTFPDPIRSDITWWDDRIWFITGQFGSWAIVGVNVAESMEAGEAVVDRQFDVDFGDLHFDGLFIEDGSLYGVPHREDSLWRFSFEGDVLQKWALPVRQVECIARDSTSLWVIHHGPSEARTNAHLLTRFLFP